MLSQHFSLLLRRASISCARMIHNEHRFLDIWGWAPLSMKCRYIIITSTRPRTPLCGLLGNINQYLQCLIFGLGLLSGLRPLRERHFDLSLPSKHAPSLLNFVIYRLLQATYCSRLSSLLGQVLRWAPAPTPRGPAASSARLLVVFVVIEYHHFLPNDLSL